MNDTELDNYLEAGRIAKEVLHSCAAEIKPGVLMGDIFDMVVDQIESKGAMLSFPPNISFNDVAAHDSPSPGDERTFSEGDLIKLDIGTHIDGYIADTAVTVNLGDHDKLCEASAPQSKEQSPLTASNPSSTSPATQLRVTTSTTASPSPTPACSAPASFAKTT